MTATKDVDQRLTFIKHVESDTRVKKALYLCKCGAKVERICYNVNNNHTTSCGCKRKGNRTHGKSNHNLYIRYRKMKERCYNQNSDKYATYGGRGIEMCEEWLGDFEVFYDWAMRNGYSKSLQIDRIDTNGNYCPGNCRWVTPKQNGANTRPKKGGTSKYKGVSKKINRFVAVFNHKHIGSFVNEIDAAIAFDEVAEAEQGEYAWLNTVNFEEVRDRRHNGNR